jgi:tetratricopeptide (TPR) repeat protein
LTAQLRAQKKNSNSGHNKYLSGIIAHNLGVLAVLTGKPDDAVAYFREAICLKEAAFGRNDAEVALSWDELGIQCFARGDFDGALTSFREAHSVRNGLLKEQQMMQSQSSHLSRGSSSSPTPPASPAQHPSVAMVLNNMACCYFQMGNTRQALLTLEEADEIQQKAVGSSAQAELDLLHVAIVICNCGYLKLALRQYEEARSMLEEALLIQQSVLDDNHRAVRDTLSNIEFANAFHS